MNKPLTKEEREGIDSVIWDTTAEKAIRALQFAAAYWREAVRDSDSYGGNGHCHFCGVFINGANVPHKPDCVWLLAQEPE